MNNDTAKIIIANLKERIELGEDGKYRLLGIITKKELDALDLLVAEKIDSKELAPSRPIEYEKNSPADAVSTVDQGADLTLDLSALDLSESSDSYRVCLDFGTAMSKATFVCDGEAGSLEEIQVLKLGIPGDQEQIDEYMLVSSVYIDIDGMIWFGKHAVDRAQVAEEGRNARMDNIKRALSEGNMDELVDEIYNPTAHWLTYENIVLAYLAFFTWTVNSALLSDVSTHSIATNFKRRFAMPCFPRVRAQMVEEKLKILLGEAQILATTFGAEIHQGLSLDKFLSAVKQLRAEKKNYPFVDRCVTEPLGVSGSLLSWRKSQDSLVLVVDIGAGTSDFSLYRLKVSVSDGGQIDIAKTVAGEVEGSARGITEAGNHLDKILMAYILKRSGIDSSHRNYINITHALERDIRNYKESLFNAGSVYIVLYDGSTIEVLINEFLALDAVKSFEESLRNTMIDILESVDSEWVKWVKSNPSRYLTIVLTGGGALLPMAKKLAEDPVTAHGITIPVALAKDFPTWLNEDYPDLEDHYSRVAVSLGGARQNTFRSMGVLKSTGGGDGGHILERFPTKGI